MGWEEAHSGSRTQLLQKEGTSRGCSQHGDSINRCRSPDISTEEGTVPPLMGSCTEMIGGTLCRDSAGAGESCTGWGCNGMRRCDPTVLLMGAPVEMRPPELSAPSVLAASREAFPNVLRRAEA